MNVPGPSMLKLEAIREFVIDAEPKTLKFDWIDAEPRTLKFDWIDAEPRTLKFDDSVALLESVKTPSMRTFERNVDDLSIRISTTLKFPKMSTLPPKDAEEPTANVEVDVEPVTVRELQKVPSFTVSGPAIETLLPTLKLERMVTRLQYVAMPFTVKFEDTESEFNVELDDTESEFNSVP